MLEHLLPSSKDALGTQNSSAGASTQCTTSCGSSCSPVGLGLTEAGAVQEPTLTTWLAPGLQHRAQHGLRQDECQQTLPPALPGAFSPGPTPQEAAGIPMPGKERMTYPQ